MEKSQKPWVRLIEQETYDSSAICAKIKRIISEEQVDVKDKSVFLKVSFVFPARDPERVKMIITNPLFIAGVCRALIEEGARVVHIADGETFGTARYSFDIVDIYGAINALPAAVKAKVRYCYLDEEKKDWITPENNFCPDVLIDYPRIAREADLYISLPKLKVNIFADVTLSVKNGMGLISKPVRIKYHNENLHSLIADIYRVRPPDYVITDAVYAGEAQGPMEAYPYPSGMILFGNNGPAVDTVCCELMDFKPAEIKHLKMISEAGYGPIKLADIRLPETGLLKKKRHSFTRPCRDFKGLSPDITQYIGDCCGSGCLPFMRALLDGYGMNRGWDSLGKFSIIAGKNLKISGEELKNLKKRRTLIFGKCAEAYSSYGVYYKGCPPDYIKALLTLPFRSSLGFTPWLSYVEITTYIRTSLVHYFVLLLKKLGLMKS